MGETLHKSYHISSRSPNGQTLWKIPADSSTENASVQDINGQSINLADLRTATGLRAGTTDLRSAKGLRGGTTGLRAGPTGLRASTPDLRAATELRQQQDGSGEIDLETLRGLSQVNV